MIDFNALIQVKKLVISSDHKNAFFNEINNL